jgi:hypothetical protein
MAGRKSNNSLLLFVPALLAGLLLFSGTAAGVVVGMDPSVIALRPGERALVNLTLDSAPTGLSGYGIGIKVEQPGIAEITAVTFPSWAGLSDSNGIPGTDIQIMAVDLKGEVEKNAERIILATFTLQGRESGTTALLLFAPVFDDDDGNNITPSLTGISVTVSTGTPGSSGGSAGGSGGGGSTTIPGEVTSPTVNQSGADTPVQTSATVESQTPLTETPGAGGTPAVLPATGEQTIAETPAGRGIPFLSLPLILMAMGIMAFMAAKKR